MSNIDEAVSILKKVDPDFEPTTYDTVDLAIDAFKAFQKEKEPLKEEKKAPAKKEEPAKTEKPKKKAKKKVFGK